MQLNSFWRCITTPLFSAQSVLFMKMPSIEFACMVAMHTVKSNYFEWTGNIKKRVKYALTYNFYFNWWICILHKIWWIVLAHVLLKSGWIIDVGWLLVLVKILLCELATYAYFGANWLPLHLMAALSHVFFGDATYKIRFPELCACPFFRLWWISSEHLMLPHLSGLQTVVMA
jgi:hypothetical protein